MSARPARRAARRPLRAAAAPDAAGRRIPPPPAMTTARAAPRRTATAKGKASDAPAPAGPPAVWRPGVDAVDDGEALQYDPTAYDTLHAFALEWPCLSFDVLPDALGERRTEFPHTMFLAAGTQAASRAANTVSLLRLARLGRAGHGLDAPGSSSEDSDSDGDDDDPVLHARSVSVASGVNRVRSAPAAPGLVAAWLENGSVAVYDMRGGLGELEAADDNKPTRPRAAKQPPLASASHGVEGYGLDWSRAAPGRLAAGDCGAGLRVWDPRDGGASWAVSAPLTGGHTASVEDVQWSPTEGTVLATGSADASIAVWDTRAKGRPQLTVPRAHAADVNVITWSRLATYMLASGGDDGAVAVWDLRSLKAGADVARLAHHRGPVTSLEWSPHESSMLVSCGEDAQTAVWDLAVERDPDEEAALGAGAAAADAVPPQLLFVHAGQADVKEAHWHPHIPGMLAATAADGFNVFRPANL